MVNGAPDAAGLGEGLFAVQAGQDRSLSLAVALLHGQATIVIGADKLGGCCGAGRKRKAQAGGGRAEGLFSVERVEHSLMHGGHTAVVGDVFRLDCLPDPYRVEAFLDHEPGAGEDRGDRQDL